MLLKIVLQDKDCSPFCRPVLPFVKQIQVHRFLLRLIKTLCRRFPFRGRGAFLSALGPFLLHNYILHILYQIKKIASQDSFELPKYAREWAWYRCKTENGSSANQMWIYYLLFFWLGAESRSFLAILCMKAPNCKGRAKDMLHPYEPAAIRDFRLKA